jgi:hypothetical protein
MRITYSAPLHDVVAVLESPAPPLTNPASVIERAPAIPRGRMGCPRCGSSQPRSGQHLVALAVRKEDDRYRCTTCELVAEANEWQYSGCEENHNV